MYFTCYLTTELELSMLDLCFTLLFPSQPWYFTFGKVCVRFKNRALSESNTGSGKMILVSWSTINFLYDGHVLCGISEQHN